MTPGCSVLAPVSRLSLLSSRWPLSATLSLDSVLPVQVTRVLWERREEERLRFSSLFAGQQLYLSEPFLLLGTIGPLTGLCGQRAM